MSGAAARAQSAPDAEAQAEADAALAQAHRAMAENAWAQAEINFERVLMFNPDHAEARLQLALLLAQRGKRDAASAFIETLVEDPRTPPDYRLRLQALLAQLQQGQTPTQLPPVPVTAQAPGQGSYLQVRSSWGYSSNPFSRADIDSLTLTLADGSATLPLLQDIRPAPQVLHSLTYQAANGCGLDLADQHWAGAEPYFSNRLMVFCNGLAGQPAAQWFAAQRRAIDGSTRTFAGLNLPLTLPLGPVRLSMQLYKEPQNERQGIHVRLDHRLPTPAGQGQAFVYAEAESANAGAPGYAKMGLWKEWLPAADTLLAAQATYQQDLGGYSPLLANGAVRHLTTLDLSLEQKWGQIAGWGFSTSAQVSRRWSNLPLFDYQDITLRAHLQRRF